MNIIYKSANINCCSKFPHQTNACSVDLWKPFLLWKSGKVHILICSLSMIDEGNIYNSGNAFLNTKDVLFMVSLFQVTPLGEHKEATPNNKGIHKHHLLAWSLVSNTKCKKTTGSSNKTHGCSNTRQWVRPMWGVWFLLAITSKATDKKVLCIYTSLWIAALSNTYIAI